MPYGMQVRTPQGLMGLTDLQAVKFIRTLSYSASTTSGTQNVTRTHTQSMNKYRDFAGSPFVLFGSTAYVSGPGGLLSVGIDWAHGQNVPLDSSFVATTTLYSLASGTHSFVTDLYIMQI